jgi:hypothetical protein
MRFIDHVCYIRPPRPECTHQAEGPCEQCQDDWKRYSEKTVAVAKELKELALKYDIPLVLSGGPSFTAPLETEAEIRIGKDLMVTQLPVGLAPMKFRVLKRRG